MAEYIEREALLDDFGEEPLVLDEYDDEQRQEHWDWYRYTTIVKKHPAADVAPVVRCSECKRFDCDNVICKMWLQVVASNDFCSYGERKDGDG